MFTKMNTVSESVPQDNIKHCLTAFFVHTEWRKYIMGLKKHKPPQ